MLHRIFRGGLGGPYASVFSQSSAPSNIVAIRGGLRVQKSPATLYSSYSFIYKKLSAILDITNGERGLILNNVCGENMECINRLTPLLRDVGPVLKRTYETSAFSLVGVSVNINSARDTERGTFSCNISSRDTNEVTTELFEGAYDPFDLNDRGSIDSISAYGDPTSILGCRFLHIGDPASPHFSCSNEIIDIRHLPPLYERPQYAGGKEIVIEGLGCLDKPLLGENGLLDLILSLDVSNWVLPLQYSGDVNDMCGE